MNFFWFLLSFFNFICGGSFENTVIFALWAIASLELKQTKKEEKL